MSQLPQLPTKGIKTNKMNKMNKEDLAWCVKRIPKNLKKLMMEHEIKISIGGGFIRSCITGDPLNDIDIFTNSKDTADILSSILVKEFKYRKIETQNAITLLREGEVPFQFIRRWVYDHPKDILFAFDFTICCSSIWFDGNTMSSILSNETSGWNGVVHDYFYRDLAAKRLRYIYPNREEEAGGSMIRVLKYYNKGYRITLSSLAGVITRLTMAIDKINLEEVYLAKVLTGLLLEVDPNAVMEETTLLE